MWIPHEINQSDSTQQHPSERQVRGGAPKPQRDNGYYICGVRSTSQASDRNDCYCPDGEVTVHEVEMYYGYVEQAVLHNQEGIKYIFTSTNESTSQPGQISYP